MRTRRVHRDHCQAVVAVGIIPGVEVRARAGVVITRSLHPTGEEDLRQHGQDTRRNARDQPPDESDEREGEYPEFAR